MTDTPNLPDWLVEMMKAAALPQMIYRVEPDLEGYLPLPEHSWNAEEWTKMMKDPRFDYVSGHVWDGEETITMSSDEPKREEESMPTITSDDIIGTRANYGTLARMELDFANENMHVFGVDYSPKVIAALANAILALEAERDVLLARLAELERWGQQVHDALDGRPLPEHPDEAPARIAALRAAAAEEPA